MRSDARKREAAPSEAGVLTEAERELIDAEGGRFDRESMFATVARIKAEAVQAERERTGQKLIERAAKVRRLGWEREANAYEDAGRIAGEGPVSTPPDFGTCEICDQQLTGGSHYHCSCGSTDVTGAYGHHGRFCKVAGGLVKEFHHCGPGGCELAKEASDD